MKKKPILEEMQRMVGLMSYDVAKTIKEQEEYTVITKPRINSILREQTEEEYTKEGLCAPETWRTKFTTKQCLARTSGEASKKLATYLGQLNALTYITNGRMIKRAGLWGQGHKKITAVLKSIAKDLNRVDPEKKQKEAQYNVIFELDKLGTRSSAWATEVAEQFKDSMEGPGAWDNDFIAQMSKPTTRYEFTQVGDAFHTLVGDSTLHKWIAGEADLDWADDVDDIMTDVDIVYNGEQFAHIKDLIKHLVAAWAAADVKWCETEVEKCKEVNKVVDDAEVDFTLLKINGEEFPWEYKLETDEKVLEVYRKFMADEKYAATYTPEFLWANAYHKVYNNAAIEEDTNLGWEGDFYLEWPGNGKIEQAINEAILQIKLGLTEGGIGRKKNEDGSYTTIKNREDEEEEDEEEEEEEENGDDNGDDNGEDDTTPTKINKCTVDDIKDESKKCEVKKGEKGGIVGYIQRKLVAAKIDIGAFGPAKDGVDNDFGSKTQIGVQEFQKKNNLPVTGIVDSATLMALEGKPKGGADTDEQKKDEKEIEQVTQKIESGTSQAAQGQINALVTRAGSVPTKELCKKLIGTAAGALKHGIKVKDTGTLKQCFNSYNFGIGQGATKVKKAYNIKGKGN